MYTIQDSHNNFDWRYMPNSLIKYNELSKNDAEVAMRWLRDNNHAGTFYRMVQTITEAELQYFIEWLQDDGDDLEIITSGDDLKISDFISQEAKGFFGQTITLDQFLMIKEGLTMASMKLIFH